MQTLLAQNIQVRNREDLLTTFDTALTGCMVVFTCLEQETEKLQFDGSNGFSKITWKMKARMLWNEEKMKDYLSLIRGQQSSLSFLIQLLQMQSIDEVYQQVERQGDLLERQATRTDSLRKLNPTANIPGSVLGVRRSAETLFGDAASTVAAKEFAFDDDIVNSKAYRRAMAMARLAISQNNSIQEVVGDEFDHIDFTGSAPDPVPEVSSPALEELKLLSLAEPPEPATSPEIVITSPDAPEAESLALESLEHSAKWEPSSQVKPLKTSRQDIAFTLPFTQVEQVFINLQNPNTGPVNFKVMTTAPTQYCVRPNFGRIEAGGSMEVLFEMVARNPSRHSFVDKFLVQSIAAASDQDLSSHARLTQAVKKLYGSPWTANFVQEKKLRVVHKKESHFP
jgi:hypothetical protein